MKNPPKTKFGPPVPDKNMGAVGRDAIAIFFAKHAQAAPAHHWMFAIDIEATYEEMKTRGANIVDDIENKPRNLRQFTIEDLDGHRFNFHHDL